MKLPRFQSFIPHDIYGRISINKVSQLQTLEVSRVEIVLLIEMCVFGVDLFLALAQLRVIYIF